MTSGNDEIKQLLDKYSRKYDIAQNIFNTHHIEGNIDFILEFIETPDIINEIKSKISKDGIDNSHPKSQKLSALSENIIPQAENESQKFESKPNDKGQEPEKDMVNMINKVTQRLDSIERNTNEIISMADQTKTKVDSISVDVMEIKEITAKAQNKHNKLSESEQFFLGDLFMYCHPYKMKPPHNYDDNMIKNRDDFREFLKVILKDGCYDENEPEKSLDNLVERIETIRDFRNKSAHGNTMTKGQAEKCYDLIMGKGDGEKSVFNMIYDVVDAQKVNDINNQKGKR